LPPLREIVTDCIRRRWAVPTPIGQPLRRNRVPRWGSSIRYTSAWGEFAVSADVHLFASVDGRSRAMVARISLASPVRTSGSSRKFGSLVRNCDGIGACSGGMRSSGVSTTANVRTPPRIRLIEYRRPSCRMIPAMATPGHHIIVAGASVPSTVPCQVHKSTPTSTLARVSVSTVVSLSLTTIFAGLSGDTLWSARTPT
jgi:hypothetical protein